MKLTTDRLSVEIADPGTIESGNRFDTTGWITQVTLDGAHTFCTSNLPEAPGGAIRAGVGLCGEFGIQRPVGYEEIAVGERFLKIGVGVLTRVSEEPYRFDMPFENEPFAIEVDQIDSRSVQHRVVPVRCNGYAVDYIKTVLVDQNVVTIAQWIKNVGSKPIVTHEYNHNFTCFDAHPIGPDYTLDFNFIPRFVKSPPWELPQSTIELLTLDGQQIRWNDRPKGSFYCRPRGYDTVPSVEWELRHRHSGVSLKYECDFPAGMVALWGMPSVVTPEIFCDIELEQGQEMNWSRRYTFNC